MAIAVQVGYVSMVLGGGAQVATPGPKSLYAITSTVTGGAITVYDNTAASGTILFTKTLAVGEVIHFGGIGIVANNGLFVAGAGTVVIAYS